MAQMPSHRPTTNLNSSTRTTRTTTAPQTCGSTPRICPRPAPPPTDSTLRGLLTHWLVGLRQASSMVQGQQPGSGSRRTWRWTGRATCTWRTRATTRCAAWPPAAPSPPWPAPGRPAIRTGLPQRPNSLRPPASPFFTTGRTEARASSHSLWLTLETTASARSQGIWMAQERCPAGLGAAARARPRICKRWRTPRRGRGSRTATAASRASTARGGWRWTTTGSSSSRTPRTTSSAGSRPTTPCTRWRGTWKQQS
mmetsp:Transcript_44281/g.76516  ORF Transcript_44281/g.76516 Transcript_44281/m.76516 type:complete len:254 (-) Transcript_44281:209-970(-)